ncbi:hypothetical protein COU91_00490 [Candidatus Saccharibacteria bacterium CG10_big_fil_rev_8_21_14_0_10_47_8]|nr:MAG: hypothetical protein COU91_00490 [Candidatus Saccharibacteria bacterium CG10_big_fil_rev_8_21_14_0_10_47_8]
MHCDDCIIWSADVPDEDALRSYLKEMPLLRVIKIDRAFVENNGLQVVDWLSHSGLRVFDDAKIVEIPSKVVEIARAHLAHKPWMLNCMAGVESSGVMTHKDPMKIDALKRFADLCLEAGTKPCAVTVLTSKSDQTVSGEFNGRTSIEQVLYYVELLQAGFTDVVCSPLELRAIRADSRFDQLGLNTPGIVMSGADAKDQARTMTPGAAIQAGATRVVIGRALTSGDPGENYRCISAEIEAVLSA